MSAKASAAAKKYEEGERPKAGPVVRLYVGQEIEEAFDAGARYGAEQEREAVVREIERLWNREHDAVPEDSIPARQEAE